ncbi:hypothetical protein GALMADRAFT_267416 [Galerina marginata CBS 339.88]|uniref:Uncharacterized protein n=1 Tax=Galerina marginata (strain CBS 339.88) TaxID=685588 RepID=A0A067T297_GALM3|nr:hypothetical protein GALMADRAFT_267416 [Galerina marginata CBS 339.88]
MNDQPMAIAVIAPPSDDDGHVSSEFDLPSEDEDMAPPPTKRNKLDSNSARQPTNHLLETGLEDGEELALLLLGRA